MMDKELIEAVETAIEHLMVKPVIDAMLSGKSIVHAPDSADLAEAAITAHLKHLEDNGMVIVPREPTNLMTARGYQVSSPAIFSLLKTWQAMINASQEGKD